MAGPMGRLHVVLIPGFAGFDALGQLEYYAGVTPLFRQWKKAGRSRAQVVLHYFDNFPTAAVVTRAARLRRYIAKRIARGEFQPGDELALVGHSTGGLDIRRLLLDLADAPDESIQVDGGEGTSFPVRHKEVLALVRRVVFLSAPQWGTNIADWVRQYALGRAVIVAELRAGVAASQMPPLEKFESWLAGGAASITGADVLLALRDSLSEADPGTAGGDPARMAAAHEAASELELWLRHMGTDFSVINDLSSQASAGADASPAHFTREMREHEMELWNAHGIRTRSYATLSPRPFQFDEGSAAPRWDLLKPWTYPEWMKNGGPDALKTDVAYRICYRACAGGPFRQPDVARMPKCLTATQQRRLNAWGNHGRIELWDNDGIVNTASMLWPDAQATVMVPADHMDIVGHYKLVEAMPGSGRKYQAYNLLNSASEFDDASFEQVWHDVFNFCAEEIQPKPRARVVKRAEPAMPAEPAVPARAAAQSAG